jgi:hypothetical protein
MSGVSREVAEHTLNIKPGSKPIKRTSTRISAGPWVKSYQGSYPWFR